MPRLISVNGCSGRSERSSFKNAQIALEYLPLRSGALVRARMNDVNVSPGDFSTGAADRRQELLVYATVEPDVGPVPKELHVIDDSHVERGIATLAFAPTVHLHDERKHLRRDIAVDQSSQPAATFPRNRVVGIHPEEPIPLARGAATRRAPPRSHRSDH